MQSDLARFAGWCFLAGVFLMVTGDGLTNFSEPFPAQAWPWLYLLPFVLACVAMLLAGRIGPRHPARVAVAYSALAGLLAVFALSTSSRRSGRSARWRLDTSRHRRLLVVLRADARGFTSPRSDVDRRRAGGSGGSPFA